MANHWSFSNDRLPEILDHSERYTGPAYWENYQAGFVKMNVQQRAEELVAWDRKMSDEVTPSRQTAELIAKRRELQALHDTLRAVDR